MNWIWWAIGFIVIDILIDILLFRMATRTESYDELSRYTPEQLLDKLEHKHVTKHKRYADHK